MSLIIRRVTKDQRSVRYMMKKKKNPRSRKRRRERGRKRGERVKRERSRYYITVGEFSYFYLPFVALYMTDSHHAKKKSR